MPPKDKTPSTPDAHAEAADKRAEAADKRAEAAAGRSNPGMVEALLAERRGYVQRELPDRVKQVDEQIRYYGGQPPAGE